MFSCTVFSDAFMVDLNKVHVDKEYRSRCITLPKLVHPVKVFLTLTSQPSLFTKCKLSLKTNCIVECYILQRILIVSGSYKHLERQNNAVKFLKIKCTLNRS